MRPRCPSGHRGSPKPVTVLLMDLDAINDRFGHALGDRVLEVFAKTTRKALRQSDLFGRLGGEEFAAVLNAAVSHCEGPAMDVTGLLAEADRALYLAKENGRNRVEIASLESYLARANVPSALRRIQLPLRAPPDVF